MALLSTTIESNKHAARRRGEPNQTTWWTQPDKLGLRRIQFEEILQNPLAHTVDAMDKSTIELNSMNCITDETMFAEEQRKKQNETYIYTKNLFLHSHG